MTEQLPAVFQSGALVAPVKACIGFMTAVERFSLTHAPEDMEKVMIKRFSQFH